MTKRTRTWYALEHIGQDKEPLVRPFDRMNDRDLWCRDNAFNPNLYGYREAVEAKHPVVQRWKRSQANYELRTYGEAFGWEAAQDIIDFIANRPGIYFNVPEAVYHAHPAISNSFLWNIRSENPAYAMEQRINPGPQTEDQAFGKLIHYAVLEPEVYAEIPRASKCCAVLKSGKREGEQCDNDGKGLWEGQWFCGTHARGLDLEVPELIITPTDATTIQRILDSLYERGPDGEYGDAYHLLIGGEMLSEVTVLFPHEHTGIMLKCRLDRWDRVNQEVPDIKTCPSAKRQNFERTIFRFGYHRKMALYEQALMYHGEPPRRLPLVAMEKGGANAVKVYDIVPRALRVGWYEIEEDLMLLKSCIDTGHYPKFGLERQDIDLPPWAYSRTEDHYSEI